jgi:uncharacterized membrane protein YvbJ
MTEPWACLKCGAELEHDWMPCPNCGWKAPGPWSPDSEEPEEASDQARFRAFSKKTPWMRLLAVFLFLILLWGLLWRFWRLR